MAVTPVDVAGSYAKGLQVNQLRQQLDAQKAAEQERNAMKSLYAERFGGTDPKSGITWDAGRLAPGGAPAMDNQQFVGRAMAINPEVGLNWQKHFAGQGAAQLERQKAEAPLFVAALENVQDQAGYTQARRMLQQRGVDVSDMPEQYDQRTSNFVLQGARYLGNISGPETLKPTTSMQEYDLYRQQGGTLPFMNWQIQMKQAGRPQTNVTNNMGKTGVDYGPPPKDMVWALDGAGTVALSEPDERGFRSPIAIPIAGGPVAMEAAVAESKAEGRAAQTLRAGTTVVQDLGRGLQLLPQMAQGDGIIGANTRLAKAGIPGTAEYQVLQFKESALSNVGLDTLQQMRENSPTGGALGQVPIQQQKRLEQVLGSLELGQKPSDIEANIQRVMNIYTDIMYGSPEERATAIRQGKMTPEQSAAIDQRYFSLPFDEMGRPIGEEGAGDTVDIGGQSISMEDLQFTADKHNMTVEQVIERLRASAGRR